MQHPESPPPVLLRLAVVGSRNVADYDTVAKAIEQAIQHFTDLGMGPLTEIISGGANGVDTLAAQWVQDHDMTLTEYRPNWVLHPYPQFRNRAIVLRNRRIAEACTALLAVWDGESPGTKMTVEFAVSLDKPTYVIYTALPESAMADIAYSVATGQANIIADGDTPAESIAELVRLLNDPDVRAKVNEYHRRSSHHAPS